jgi:hypothetical protein
VTLAILPFAVKFISVAPTENAMTVIFSIGPFAIVIVTACENKLALSMTNTVYVLTCVNVAVISTVRSESVGLTVLHLAFVATIAVFLAHSLRHRCFRLRFCLFFGSSAAKK